MERERETYRPLCHLSRSSCYRCRGDRFLWLLQHGVQLVSQIIEHAADVVEDADCGLLLSHRAKTQTHTSFNGRTAGGRANGETPLLCSTQCCLQ